MSHSTLFYLNNSEMVTGRNFTRNKPRIGTVLVRKKNPIGEDIEKMAKGDASIIIHILEARAIHRL